MNKVELEAELSNNIPEGYRWHVSSAAPSNVIVTESGEVLQSDDCIDLSIRKPFSLLGIYHTTVQVGGAINGVYLGEGTYHLKKAVEKLVAQVNHKGNRKNFAKGRIKMIKHNLEGDYYVSSKQVS
jgi:hypothetical protein